MTGIDLLHLRVSNNKFFRYSTSSARIAMAINVQFHFIYGDARFYLRLAKIALLTVNRYLIVDLATWVPLNLTPSYHLYTFLIYHADRNPRFYSGI